jgi:hypothetical protein
VATFGCRFDSKPDPAGGLSAVLAQRVFAQLEMLTAERP